MTSNTNLRAQAKNEFEKGYFKLLNNAFFGRTMMNVRKFMSFELVNDEKRAMRCIANPRYKHRCVFSKYLTGIHFHRKKCLLNVPIYLGFSILDISKTVMYEYWYNYLKPKFDERIELAYTDTDSFIYSVQSEDYYAEIKGNIDRIYDTSNYPHDHPLYSTKNKKIPGYFKNELGAKIMSEFIALCPKMYSVIKLCLSDEEYKTGKGVNKPVLEKRIKHKHYKDCVFEGIEKREIMTRFHTKNHIIYTVDITKTALSSKNDKVAQVDVINTLPYGHYSLVATA